MAAAEEDAAERGNVRGATVKGTVRPLAESISVEEAERASRQVREAISQQQRQLDELQRFSDENKSLSELVLELPDSVSHRIMVLLGENHYAERSAKQTVEILERRSEFLDQKIGSAKAQIADLEAESSFVINTAEEAKAGLVEIREEYEGSGQLQLNEASTSRITAAAASSPTSSGSQAGSGFNLEVTTSGSGSVGADEDHEHDLLMARLSELEMAEAAAGEDEDEIEEDSDDEGYDNSNTGVFEPFMSNHKRSEVDRNENDLLEKEYDSEEVEEEDSQLDHSDDDADDYVEDAQRSSEEEINTEDGDEDNYGTWKLGDKQKPESLGGRPLSRFAREVYAKKGAFDSRPAPQKFTFRQGSPADKKPQSAANYEIYSRTLERPEDTQGFNDLHEERQDWRRQGVYKKESLAEDIKEGGASSSDLSRVPSLGEPAAAQLKAFTGIVTEHSSAEPAPANEPQVQEAQQSRPISKFKMRQAQGGRR